MSYRVLKWRVDLADEYIEDVKAEFMQAQYVTVEEAGRVLVWTGDAASEGSM
jgi:hypothetical protein